MDAGKRAAARYAVDTYVKVSKFHFQRSSFHEICSCDQRQENKMRSNIRLIYQLFKYFCVSLLNFLVVERSI